jgi:hypothetical protein
LANLALGADLSDRQERELLRRYLAATRPTPSDSDRTQSGALGSTAGEEYTHEQLRALRLLALMRETLAGVMNEVSPFTASTCSSVVTYTAAEVHEYVDSNWARLLKQCRLTGFTSALDASEARELQCCSEAFAAALRSPNLTDDVLQWLPYSECSGSLEHVCIETRDLASNRRAFLRHADLDSQLVQAFLGGDDAEIRALRQNPRLFLTNGDFVVMPHPEGYEFTESAVNAAVAPGGMLAWWTPPSLQRRSVYFCERAEAERRTQRNFDDGLISVPCTSTLAAGKPERLGAPAKQWTCEDEHVLRSIADLRREHLPQLEELKRAVHAHLRHVFGVEDTSKYVMLFNYPNVSRLSLLHVHICDEHQKGMQIWKQASGGFVNDPRVHMVRRQRWSQPSTSGLPQACCGWLLRPAALASCSPKGRTLETRLRSLTTSLRSSRSLATCACAARSFTGAQSLAVCHAPPPSLWNAPSTACSTSDRSSASSGAARMTKPLRLCTRPTSPTCAWQRTSPRSCAS